jgi:hypothetical protein
MDKSMRNIFISTGVLFAFLCALLLSSCGSRVVLVEDIGMIRNVIHAPQSAFNGDSQTTIKCDSAVISIRGNKSIHINRHAVIYHYEDGDKWFAYDGSEKMWRVM